MIRFALTCGNDHRFEGWFRSSDDFDRQAEEGSLVCPVCQNERVTKAIMAPSIARGPGKDEPVAADKTPQPASVADAKAARALKMMRKMRSHIEKNFENVGDRFASEARAIHCGEADARDIYGRATLADAKSLHEDGISVLPIPDLPKLDG